MNKPLSVRLTEQAIADELSSLMVGSSSDTISVMATWVSNRLAYHQELLRRTDKPIHYDNLLYHRHCIELLQDIQHLFFPLPPDQSGDKGK